MNKPTTPSPITLENCPVCSAPLCGCEAEETVTHYGCDHFPDTHSWAKHENLMKIGSLIALAKEEERKRIKKFCEDRIRKIKESGEKITAYRAKDISVFRETCAVIDLSSEREKGEE